MTTPAAPNASYPTYAEQTVIQNFLWTLPQCTVHEAMAMAEDEIRSSGLSRAAARELGAAIREKFAR